MNPSARPNPSGRPNPTAKRSNSLGYDAVRELAQNLTNQFWVIPVYAMAQLALICSVYLAYIDASTSYYGLQWAVDQRLLNTAGGTGQLILLAILPQLAQILCSFWIVTLPAEAKAQRTATWVILGLAFVFDSGTDFAYNMSDIPEGLFWAKFVIAVIMVGINTVLSEIMLVYSFGLWAELDQHAYNAWQEVVKGRKELTLLHRLVGFVTGLSATPLIAAVSKSIRGQIQSTRGAFAARMAPKAAA